MDETGPWLPNGFKRPAQTCRDPKTFAPRPVTDAERVEYAAELEDLTRIRPKTRAECRDGIRPCPFVACRYNLYLDVNEKNGHVKFNVRGEPWTVTDSCALDVAAASARTLEEVAERLGLTRERARQIEALGLEKLKEDPTVLRWRSERAEGLFDTAMDEPSGHWNVGGQSDGERRHVPEREALVDLEEDAMRRVPYGAAPARVAAYREATRELLARDAGTEDVLRAYDAIDARFNDGRPAGEGDEEEVAVDGEGDEEEVAIQAGGDAASTDPPRAPAVAAIATASLVPDGAPAVPSWPTCGIAGCGEPVTPSKKTNRSATKGAPTLFCKAHHKDATAKSRYHNAKARERAAAGGVAPPPRTKARPALTPAVPVEPPSLPAAACPPVPERTTTPSGGLEPFEEIVDALYELLPDDIDEDDIGRFPAWFVRKVAQYLIAGSR